MPCVELVQAGPGPQKKTSFEWMCTKFGMWHPYTILSRWSWGLASAAHAHGLAPCAPGKFGTSGQ